MSGYRQERLNDLLKLTIADILQRSMKDPRLGFITITRVHVTRDLQRARVFVSSPTSAQDRQQSVDTLNHAHSFIQREAGRQLRLKYTPHLEFFEDQNIDYPFHIDSVLNSLHKTTENNSYQEIAAVIQSHRKLYISTHQNPEGDALGSSLAFYSELTPLGYEVRVVIDDPIGHPLTTLPHVDRIQQGVAPEEDDLVIIVDCPHTSRICSPFRDNVRSERVINLDHHLGNDYYGEYNRVEPEASAAGELVYFVLRHISKSFNRDTATLIYTAILTDTGSFRFANTTENAFFIASELMKCGLNPHEVAQKMYENHSFTRLKLLGNRLANMQLSSDGKIGWISVTLEQLEEFGANRTDLEGFVNYPRYIKGVEVAVFFYEVESGKVKASFRSKSDFDVARVARRHGGGGHKSAAACVLEGSLEEVQRAIIDELQATMASEGQPMVQS